MLNRRDKRDINYSKEGRMYATQDRSACPVYSFDKYVKKLNADVDYLLATVQ